MSPRQDVATEFIAQAHEACSTFEMSRSRIVRAAFASEIDAGPWRRRDWLTGYREGRPARFRRAQQEGQIERCVVSHEGPDPKRLKDRPGDAAHVEDGHAPAPPLAEPNAGAQRIETGPPRVQYQLVWLRARRDSL